MFAVAVGGAVNVGGVAMATPAPAPAAAPCAPAGIPAPPAIPGGAGGPPCMPGILAGIATAGLVAVGPGTGAWEELLGGGAEAPHPIRPAPTSGTAKLQHDRDSFNARMAHSALQRYGRPQPGSTNSAPQPMRTTAGAPANPQREHCRTLRRRIPDSPPASRVWQGLAADSACRGRKSAR